jgi:hypothetical protein
MKNPFKVGEEAPPELEEMWALFTWQAPSYLDAQDYLRYGLRGYEIEDQETADRLFETYKKFLAEFKPEKFKVLFG